MLTKPKILLSNILNTGADFRYEKMHYKLSGAVDSEFWIYPHWNPKKVIVVTRVIDRVSVNTGFTLKQNEHNAKLFSLYYEILLGRQSLLHSENELYRPIRCSCCYDVNISFIHKNKPYELLNGRVLLELEEFESLVHEKLL